MLLEQKNRLEKSLGYKVIGFRSHYLKLELPKSWINLAKVGIKYDTTLGYHDACGFRSGICHPYKPINPLTNKYIDILVFPLSVMDCTLDNYLGLNLNESFKLVKKVIDAVKSNKGVFNIVWHNSYFIDEQLELYEKILNYLSENNAWMTSGKNIYNHWTNNNFETEFLKYLD